MEDFRPKVPLLVALRNKGMTTRHWEEISAKVGFTVKPTIEDFNFQKVLDMKLMDHCEYIVDVGDRAGKEY